MGIENISTYGGRVDALFWAILALTGIAFIITESILLYSIIRFRRRDGEKASYVHGNRRLEVTWTAVPGILFFGLAVVQVGTWREIKSDLPPATESLEIMLEAEQFEWYPTYAGPDGTFRTDDDIEAPVNILHVPVNQKVIIHLSSRDVLHSFFVPALRLKQDAIPGRSISLWFEAVETGEYEIVCAELCGLGHYRMRGFLTVEADQAFEEWLAEVASR